MGMRTVVMLSLDYASQWSIDRKLGRKISDALMHVDGVGNMEAAPGVYIVQSTLSDDETLALIDGVRGFRVMSRSAWEDGIPGEDLQTKLKMLRLAASNLGYDLVKREDE